MPGGEEFIFSENLTCSYSNFVRSEIDSLYQPLNSNPYSRLYDKKEIAKLYEEKLTRIKSADFSNLVRAIHGHKGLSASILLLLEASSVRSLLLIPSAFAVVVESLAKIISTTESGKEYPIQNKITAEKLKKKLIEIVKSFSDVIEPQRILKIERRINEINRPVVKDHLSNNEKLTHPFEQMNISLTANDIKAIEHRNDLFHGNILLDGDDSKSTEETNNYMGYISGKLYTLVTTLILKHIGYSGYIINHAKFYEESCGLDSEEEYFRWI